MTRAYLTTVEVVDLLDAAYLADCREKAAGPSVFTRIDLATLLSCHDDLRMEAWQVWQQELRAQSRDVRTAEQWFFTACIQSCPPDWPK